MMEIIQGLTELASRVDIAVVVTNQLTTKVTNDNNTNVNNSFPLSPFNEALHAALGETFATSVGVRLILKGEGGQRGMDRSGR